MAAPPYSGFVLIAEETSDGILFKVWGWDDLNIETEAGRTNANQVVGLQIPPSPIGLDAALTASVPAATLKKTQHVATQSIASTRFAALLSALMTEVPA